jgi:hypothetical protein
VAFVHRMFGMERALKRGRLGFQLEPETAEAPPPAFSWPPLIVDADGLNAIAQARDWAARLPGPAILTPHPGEMARLTGLEKAAIEADRLRIARQFAQAWAHVVVLKGAFTVVAAPDGRALVMPFANPAMATAGTGMCWQEPSRVCEPRAWAPSRRRPWGPICTAWPASGPARRSGRAGVTAGDLLPRLPMALRALGG